MSDVIQDCLKAHNEYRAQHGVPPLTLSDKLSKIAQAHANTMAKNDKMKHSEKEDRLLDGQKTGENIANYWSKPSKPADGRRPVDSWYNEIENYDFHSHTSKKGTVTGHFTQVVWKVSTELGVGFAQSEGQTWYYCCNYYPAGNFKGKYEANVAPKK